MRLLVWAAVVGGVFVGCGGEGGVDEPDDVDAGLVVDAGNVVDAGVLDAAPSDAGPSVPACVPDSGAGKELTTACWSRAELAARGCVAAWIARPSPSGTTSTVLAGAAEASSSARFTLLYNVPGILTEYLCSGAVPATDWRCNDAHKLADCVVNELVQSCEVKVVVPALPTVHAICTQGPA